MCYYILNVTMCGHWEAELCAGPSCQRFMDELARIHRPEAWNSAGNPNAENTLPYDWPQPCEPNYYNTVQSLFWCGWECRNTHDPWGLTECYTFPNGNKQWHGRKEPMGEPAATYGEPRLGVGWRE
ncbi:hypothetical protein PG990_005736 [Apiospora arundinis]|uniref:Uncharacterized protein n=1 Tax=Apiospora arundinis TaxID=335852 RepID=A0ABR2J882_9PEZI